MPEDNPSKPPPAQGVRQQWMDMPAKIRKLIEKQLGSKVVNAETQHGGFSPGVAARIYTADNQCCFLKALGTEHNPTSVLFHRNEIKINTQLPTNTFAPRLLWSHDDADDTEWVAMIFDNIDGINPITPWQQNDLERVIQAMGQLSTMLTPSPIEVGQIPGSEEHFSKRIHGWQQIKANEASVERLDAWSQRHLDALCELEEKAPAAVAGHTLVHFDIRADNIVMTDDDVWFVDWPHASIGAAWLDAILFAPSVAMQGGLSPEALIQRFPACRQADPEAITASVVSIAGMYAQRSLQPSPPGLPTLREFQKAHRKVTQEWVAQRTGWQ